MDTDASVAVGGAAATPALSGAAPVAVDTRRGAPAGREAARHRPSIAKRVLDIALGGVALVLAAPLLGVLAVLVAVTSPGPVLFRQRRYGLGGRPFEMLKFRTMVENAEDRLPAVLNGHSDARTQLTDHGKIQDDPRVTRLGRLLRRLSLDELPQLVNVLRGDMSLVGPRPRWGSFELRGYGDELGTYFSVRPGLTGPWQVSGRNSLPDAERVRMDLSYARERTLWGDLILLLRTIPVLLWPFDRGAY